MENMDKDVHSISVEELKSITFQVVPSFYWKYEWSYNEFMIHRVGKLKAPSKELEMYDMLGNVWEWVRDDWTADVSALNGKSNPIADDRNGSATKVIKGGAFDQLIRKVISPSRESLSQDQFMSRFATQANVGFRPSMVFTQEFEGGWVPGEPVDLFFLYDASGSSDNAIQSMVEQSKKIVEFFAGDCTNDNSKIDNCHVGSALFMGEDIHLMCCQKCHTV
jgi:hypothetical protein